jgi:NAD(P)-dependent dehydrogenase (short-subunit alcohol dehydrogenase family)
MSVLDRFSLKGTVAIVTGAFSGLGCDDRRGMVRPLDILVNNAGLGVIKPALRHSSFVILGR